ncbi:MAG: hypothetical protein KJ747_07475 [Actinobacteria bacterium]|nr:hypothetical protein [Actinomycetota bacterium]MCG2806990.1 hypothetical protein [Coriobacteriia bacterium]
MTINTARRGLALVGLLATVVLATFVLSGCSTESVVADEGEYSCIDCHTDRDLLQADLTADPKPVKEKAESEGEG